MTVAVRLRLCLALAVLALALVPASHLHASGFAVENTGARAMGFAGAYVAQSYDPVGDLLERRRGGPPQGQAALPERRLRRPQHGLRRRGAPSRRSGPSRPPTATSALLPSIYYTQQVGERLGRGRGLLHPVRLPEPVGQPRRVHRPLHLHRVPDPGAEPESHRGLQDRGPARDRRGRSTYSLRASTTSSACSRSPTPSPSPPTWRSSPSTAPPPPASGGTWDSWRRPSENFSIGLHYRSKVSAEYDGTAAFNQILTGNSVVDTVVAASLPPNQPVVVSHYYPSSLTGGIAIRRENWTDRGRHRLHVLVQLRRRDLHLPVRGRAGGHRCSSRTTATPGRGASGSSTS